MRFISPLLFFVAQATQRELAEQIQYLKAENEILRARLPKQLRTTREEREKLLKFGLPLGTAIQGLISIVHPATFKRWAREDVKQKGKPPRSTRRTPEQVAALIVRLARETGWGYTRIIGELRKLGIRKISRGTVKNILDANGIEPAPKRPVSSWKAFIQRHADTLWACDFFTQDVWTPLGRRRYHILAMIHIGSRRVKVLGITDRADGRWMAERARELVAFFRGQDQPPTLFMHDRDRRFLGRAFDGVLKAAGIPAQPLSPASPNLNAHMERWIGSIKQECLDHFLIFGHRHLRYLIDEYVAYYNTVRPHQGIGNETIRKLRLVGRGDEPVGKVECETWLGGVLKHYRRAA